MSKLRIEKPLDKRYGPGYAARRAAKRADRATFRQQAQMSFGQLGQGLRVMDHAIVGVYEQFVTFRHLQMAGDAVVLGLMAFVTAGVSPVLHVVLGLGAVGVAAYTAYSFYATRKRAADAREQALMAALAQQQKAGVAPPPQQPQEAHDHESH